LQGGFILIVMQLINFIIAGLIYFPFFRAVDKKAYQEEQQSQSELGA
jgi:PTS system cellobiose-specific IIC component